jgi:hypothetical protein
VLVEVEVLIHRLQEEVEEEVLYSPNLNLVKLPQKQEE